MAASARDPAELDFYSFVALAKRTLAEEYGFRHQRATEVLLTLNRVSDLVTYDLEAVIHRPRGRSWAAFRLLFVVWLAGPMESKSAARLTGDEPCGGVEPDQEPGGRRVVGPLARRA